MRAAQVALAALTGVLIAAATIMFITDDNDFPGWIFAGFGLFGFLTLLAMIVSDAAPTRRLPPPPR